MSEHSRPGGRTHMLDEIKEQPAALQRTLTPYSTADFRHGPAALAKRGLPIILFAPPGRTAGEAQELLQWLRDQC